MADMQGTFSWQDMSADDPDMLAGFYTSQLSNKDGGVPPFGLIDFDQYLIQHWDLLRPIQTDKNQWRQLCQQYWQLYPSKPWVSRYSLHNELSFTNWAKPYHKDKLDAEQDWRNQDEPPPAYPELEQRIAPFQTSLERRLGDGSRTQCCLRTCYDPELEEDYQQFICNYQIDRDIGGILYACGSILDDAERYKEMDGDPMEVLYNMPGYTDVVDVIDEALYDELLPWNDEEWAARDPGAMDPCMVVLEVYNIIMILDTEALEEGLLNVKWLNWRSEVVWENKLYWGTIDSSVQIWLQGFGIYDFSDRNGGIIGEGWMPGS
ncbi:uncharacterized protein J7T54_005058 [Emericellopsis cladophorae]|uniref:Uncharacterized protein n=1 Tax=Emericellopsis cladophorae TaxID=2686198 RepID=A0A9Q0BBY3_9HYPO|nr:uncharacterized protein J7T54_005058 [Emericellopsis cladophorae]KAI6778534.1 hypothetical protein J7T54_005058 [Emericellopsis cladophorae]